MGTQWPNFETGFKFSFQSFPIKKLWTPSVSCYYCTDLYLASLQSRVYISETKQKTEKFLQVGLTLPVSVEIGSTCYFLLDNIAQLCLLNGVSTFSLLRKESGNLEEWACFALLCCYWEWFPFMLEVMFSSGSGNRMGGASASPSISWQIAKVL